MSADATNATTAVLETMRLPRGGVVVSTSLGPVQLGMPPETIKDSMKLGLPVPRHYIVPSEPFTRSLGANMGVNVAEFEFPAYCNFFFKGQSINLVVSSIDVERRIRQVFQETLFGPAALDLEDDFPLATPRECIPDMQRELEYFRRFGDKLITLDMLLRFTHFNDQHEAVLVQEDTRVVIRKNSSDGHGEPASFTIVDGSRSVTLADAVELPPPPPCEHLQDAFYPPAFGVTVLGSSHGFDPHGKTSGYVLWINHRGIMIDPPPFSSSILVANNIPALMIDGVILTHCHADHDAGTFQKILQEGRVALITTNTIYRSFLRKYSALSGFDADFLTRVLDHRSVRINDPTTIRGADFRFFYSLHSIPCVGFEVTYGDKRIVFSGDTLNDVARIQALHDEGVLSALRRDELLNFPWHCDAILHEAGVPPIHTPLKTLMNLDESIRKRVYVVHTAVKDIPADCGLRGAPEGVHSTITLSPRLPENAGALEILDLVRKVDLFTELTLNHAYEILQMARRVTYAKNSVVRRSGDVGDKFYIIIVGEAEALYHQDSATGGGDADGDADGDGSSCNSAAAGDTRCSPTRSRSHHRGYDQSNSYSHSHSHSQSHSHSHGHGHSRSRSQGGPGPSHAQEPQQDGDEDAAGGSPTRMRKRVSMLSLAKHYFPGDYFDLQSLLTPNWVLPYQMVATTKLSLLEFSALDFNWFLRHTATFGRIQRLAHSRLNFSHHTIEANEIFRRLTSAQRTHLEILLNQRDVTEGQVLWDVGDKCATAIIVDKAQCILKNIPSSWTSSSTSMAATSSPAANGGGGGAATGTASRPGSPSPSTPPIVSRKHRGSGNRIVPLDMSTLASKPDSEQDVILTQGCFVGDVNKLIQPEDSTHSTTLVCSASGSIFYVNKADFQSFLLENPGILLSLSGKLFAY